MGCARLLGAAFCALVLFHPAAAFAHNPLPGLEGFYVGLVHPLTTPDQILVLLATGLVLGSFALSSLIPPFAVLVVGLLGGLLLGQAGEQFTLWMFVWASLVAAWAALLPGRGWFALFGLAALSGLALGWASVPAEGPATDRIVTMAGSFFGAGLAIFYVTGVVEFAREQVKAPWLPIAFRVLAAWVAAVGVIMAAFTIVGLNATA